MHAAPEAKRPMTDHETDCYMRGFMKGLLIGAMGGGLLGIIAFIAGINSVR